MIKAIGRPPRYRTEFTNGKTTFFSDTAPDKGGSGEGFRPHELLEAALASCMNMTIRMFAEKHSIPVSSVVTTVTLDRSSPSEVCFEYFVDLAGDLTEGDRQRLLEVAESCPVRQTLSRGIVFREKR